MIPDRIIEQNTLTTNGTRAAVEVRLPWYRALPASCIRPAGLSIDGKAADDVRWEMNGKTFTFDELATNTDEWWFPTDSVVLSGNVDVDSNKQEHTVDVDLSLYIPYIIISDSEVLHIDEHDSKTMTLRQAQGATS